MRGELRPIIVALLVVSLTFLGGRPATAQSAFSPRGQAVDPAKGSQPLLIGTVGIGIEPLAVAVNPTTHRLYASGGSTVRVMDGPSTAIVSSIGLPPPGGDLRAIAVDPQASRIYVGDSYLGTISTLDGETNSLVSTMYVRSPVNALAVNQVTNRLYAATFNEVQAIDPTRNAVVGSVRIANASRTSVPSTVAVNPRTNLRWQRREQPHLGYRRPDQSDCRSGRHRRG